jgi:hypothetical protein
MDKFSYNLKEHFQDNSVDYSETDSGNVSIRNLITTGNADFNHKEPSLWKYLGVHNLSKNQIDCTFDCVQKGLDCSGVCGTFDKKCANKCTSESFKCVKSCLEKPEEDKKKAEAKEKAKAKAQAEAKAEAEAEAEEDPENMDKSERLKRNEFDPMYYDGVSDVYAAFTPTDENSFTVKTNPGVWGDMANKALDEESRAELFGNYLNEMR